MDSFRRQASKLRDQVAKQQQAVIKHISGPGYESSDIMVIDEVELQRHQQLDKLYKSTRSGRDFQKELVKAAEVFATLGYRKIEAGTKLSEECCKYGAENIEDNILAKAASIYGDARKHVEKEQEDLNKLLLSQILDPLRQMSTGTPLEDARHLAQRYSLLGKEAAGALSAVESQQQRLTFQRLVALVEAEKNYHVRIATILNEVEAEMVSEKQQKEAAPPVLSIENNSGKKLYCLAEVTPSGWSEGECKGKAGWFPTAYVENRQRIPARNAAADVY
uniref:SH3 domain-containing protein n=1 Tax=Chenopodium quinoa TaxID=63459 RepID=A0A803MV80_CHEQI